MISSRPEFNRVRPLLGTYLKIALTHVETREIADELNQKVNAAFEEAARLEKIFSKFDQNSNLNFINNAPLNTRIQVEPELFWLLKESVEIWGDSKHSFNPFNQQKIEVDPIDFKDDFSIKKNVDFSLDLNGIAKGTIVDLIASIFDRGEVSGFVNAGGDVRFFNTEIKKLNLRLGSPDIPVSREIQIQRNSIATSVPRHFENMRSTLTGNHSVSVLSERCAIADALTKVYIYGDFQSIVKCCEKYAAEVLVFSPNGELLELVTEQ